MKLGESTAFEIKLVVLPNQLNCVAFHHMEFIFFCERGEGEKIARSVDSSLIANTLRARYKPDWDIVMHCQWSPMGTHLLWEPKEIYSHLDRVLAGFKETLA